MVDVFEEVEDQIRSERYRELLMKSLPWILGVAAAALLLTLGWWGYDSWSRAKGDKAAEAYMAGLQALGQNDQAGAFAQFETVEKSGARGYRALGLMAKGGMRMEAGKTDEAVALWDAAAKAATDPMIGDLARLKSALALLDTASYKDLEGRLTPLMADGRPYRLSAREALAYAKLMAGKTSEARDDFVYLTQVLDASQGLRQRAGAAVSLIDSGSAAAIPAAVKAAAALPPPAPAMPGELPPGFVPPGAPQGTPQ